MNGRSSFSVETSKTVLRVRQQKCTIHVCALPMSRVIKFATLMANMVNALRALVVGNSKKARRACFNHVDEPCGVLFRTPPPEQIKGGTKSPSTQRLLEPS